MASSRKMKSAKARAVAEPSNTQTVEGNRYYSRAVGKSFELIDLLNRAHGALSLTELASRIGLTKSSTFRLLFTLQALRHVKQDDEGKYRLAVENWISPSAQITNTLITVAKEPSQSLRTRFQETVSLAVLYTNHIEVVQGFESPRVIRMANTLGGIIPPHASSLGKAITAFQTEQVQSKLIHSYGIRRFTDHTITDEVAVMAELAQVRTKGFAIEDEEAFVDGCCVGCPIFAGGEIAVAALSMSMPKFRLPQGKGLDSLIADVRSTANIISDNLKVRLGSR
jgi:DNA-binding IclR family transcriptional regulator